jgi:hypothetical protein
MSPITSSESAYVLPFLCALCVLWRLNRFRNLGFDISLVFGAWDLDLETGVCNRVDTLAEIIIT